MKGTPYSRIRDKTANKEDYTTIGLRISGYGAAEVVVDFAEELRHTETNPMCSIHKTCRMSS